MMNILPAVSQGLTVAHALALKAARLAAVGRRQKAIDENRV